MAPNAHLPTNAPAEEDLALDSLIHEMDLPAMLHAVEEQPALARTRALRNRLMRVSKKPGDWALTGPLVPCGKGKKP